MPCSASGMLLEMLELEEKWADMIADWIDYRHRSGFPRWRRRQRLHLADAGLSPPNMRITRTSELLAINEFGLERYRKLEPFVGAAAGHVHQSVHCFAGGARCALGNKVSEFTRDARELAAHAQTALLSEPAGFPEPA